MNVFIRADASTLIATGHVIRTLTLADRLRRRGAKVSYVCRELPGNLCNLITQHGFVVHRLPFGPERAIAAERLSGYERWLGVDFKIDLEESRSLIDREDQDIDWLIVDHYALDWRWELALRKYVRYILVIDDLEDRKHSCDLLLNQNFCDDADHPQESQNISEHRSLLGPTFALLRDEFVQERMRLKPQCKKVGRLLVYFGGADPDNETGKALSALELMDDSNLSVEVIVGPSNPNSDRVAIQCERMSQVRFHQGVEKMAKMIASCDLALGASGSSTWERCCLGLPALLVAVADNQEQIGRNAELLGVARYLGPSSALKVEDIARELAALLHRPDQLVDMSQRGMALVDGLGTERVISAMEEIWHREIVL